jgi:hypothetical protein
VQTMSSVPFGKPLRLQNLENELIKKEKALIALHQQIKNTQDGTLHDLLCIEEQALQDEIGVTQRNIDARRLHWQNEIRLCTERAATEY